MTARSLHSPDTTPMQFDISGTARAFRFLAVGIAATLIHLVVALALSRALPAVSIYVSNALAFTVAFLVSFYGHVHVTFRRGGSMPRFLVVALAGFGLNNLLLGGGTALGLRREFALGLAIGLVPVFTYVASSLWAFSQRDAGR